MNCSSGCVLGISRSLIPASRSPQFWYTRSLVLWLARSVVVADRSLPQVFTSWFVAFSLTPQWGLSGEHCGWGDLVAHRQPCRYLSLNAIALQVADYRWWCYLRRACLLPPPVSLLPVWRWVFPVPSHPGSVAVVSLSLLAAWCNTNPH